MTIYFDGSPYLDLNCLKVATLVDLLQCRANQEPDKTAYIFLTDGKTEAASLTYQELERRSRAIASLILDRLN